MATQQEDDDNPSTILGSTLNLDPDLRAQLRRDIAEESPRGSILVVEEDPNRPVAQMLEAAEFGVWSTDDGAEATQLLASMRFDAVLSDVIARSVGGLELLRFVREHDADLPILLMTGAPDVETAAQAVEHGAFQYLLKPLPADRLLPALDKAVKRSRAKRSEARVLSVMDELETIDHHPKRPPRGPWDNTLKTLFMMYQPIVLPGGKLYAYEALVRSDEPTMRGAGPIIDMAEAMGEFQILGRTVRQRAGEFAVRAHGQHYLFVNLHADDLLDELLTQPDQLLSQVAPAVVLEITERAALHDIDEAKVKMNELRSMGFRIALDDLGAGYAGLTSFTQIRPDVVKLDMALVRDVDKDKVKQKLIRSITDVSGDMGALVVGEGVETASEKDTLIELGCHLLQGYYFGKPEKR